MKKYQLFPAFEAKGIFTDSRYPGTCKVLLATQANLHYSSLQSLFGMTVRYILSKSSFERELLAMPLISVIPGRITLGS